MRFLTLLHLAPPLLSILFLTTCQQESPPQAPPPVSVTAWTVHPVNVPVVWKYIGFAESSHTVQIQPRVQGYLQKIAYIEGAIVQEGDLLFQIDPTQFKAAVERAQGTVSRQEAVLANAVLTVGRLEPLYKEKAASKKDLDQAVSQKLSAQATLQSAQASLLDAQINLGYTSIHAPVRALADRSLMREGSLITPGQNSLLTTLSVIDPIWINFTVSDNDVLQVRKEVEKGQLVLPPDDGYKVELILSDGSTFPYQGKVTFNSPTYNRKTGTMLIRASVPNPPQGKNDLGALHPGQFVEVHVLGAIRPSALCIPRRALLQKKEGLFVYTIDHDNKVHPQDVEAGEWDGEMQCISYGLKPGDRIVVDGTNKIGPLSVVDVAKEWQPTASTAASPKAEPFTEPLTPVSTSSDTPIPYE